jgi:hypothetical protein
LFYKICKQHLYATWIYKTLFAFTKCAVLSGTATDRPACPKPGPVTAQDIRMLPATAMVLWPLPWYFLDLGPRHPRSWTIGTTRVYTLECVLGHTQGNPVMTRDRVL